jgi:ketosteroid isomerase-like protein
VTQAATDHITDNDAILRRLLDESEIRTVLARYARGIDRRDWEMVRSCYHPDATDAHGGYNGGVEGFIDNSRSAWDETESMSHHINQTLIEVDGDSAWVESYCLCYVRLKSAKDGEKPKDILGNIRYVDLFERRDGEWRIALRKLVHHPGRIDVVAIDKPLSELAFLSRADAEDPSYDRRPEAFLPDGVRDPRPAA